MKKLFASFVVSASALMLISCGSNSSDPNYYGYGYAAPPVPTCPVNTVWNGTACVNSTGVAPATGPAYFYDYKSYYYQNVFGFPQNGDLVIVDTGAYQQFLKEAMGVCDRNIWGWQAGLADCANWASGSFIVQFSIDSTLKPSVSFTAYPGPTYYSINFGLNGGGAVLNPLVLSSNNTFSLINNSHGFEIRAQGSYWNGGGLRLIQIQVANGTLNDGYFNFDLYYPYNNVATKIASGKFKRR